MPDQPREQIHRGDPRRNRPYSSTSGDVSPTFEPVPATSGPSPRPDAELVLAACAGDSGAWAEIVDRHLPTVNRVARSYGLPRQDREDAVQTVWLNLNQHLPRLHHPHLLRAWLIRVTGDVCGRQRDRLRKLVPVDPHRLVAESGSALVPDVEDVYLRKERHAELYQAIDALGPADRRVARHYLDDSPGAAPLSHRTTANERRNLLRRLRRSLDTTEPTEGVRDP